MPNRNACIHIVDDDEAIRESTKLVLEHAGFACKTYRSAVEFLRAGEHEAGCALVDVRMPAMDGLTLLAELSARGSSLPVIIVTGFADVPLAVKAMQAGAVDFVEKPAAPGAIVDAVRRVLDKVRSTDAERRDAHARFQRLTERELEVLKLVVAGDPNKIVAHKLGISPRTVEIHRSRLMEKTQAKSLAELVRQALAAGIGGEK